MALQYIAAGSAGATTITIPSGHALGDLLVMFAFRDGSTTIPTVPTGWTTVGTNTGTSCSSVVAFKVCETAAETSGTWTNASMLACQVYRGQKAVNPVVNSGSGSGTGTSIDYPAITTMTEPGKSWVARFAGHSSVDTSLETAPSGYTNRTNTASATAEVSGFDSNGVVSSVSSNNVAAGGTSGNWITKSLEILAASDALAGMKSAMFGAENTAPSTSAVNYNWPAPSQTSTWSATEAQRTTLMNEAITVTAFRIYVDTAPGTAASGKKYVYTLRANSVNTGVTAVMTDTETSASWSGSITLPQYAFIAMVSTPVSTPTAPTNLYWQIEYQVAGQYFFMNGGSGLVSTSATNYISPSGQNQTTGSATSTDYEIIVPASGIITELSTKIDVGLTSSMAYAVSVRVNDTTDYLTATMNSSSSGATSVGSVAVSAGDRLVIKCVPSNTPTAARLSTCLTIVPATNGETFFGYGSAAAPSTSGTNYEQINSVGNASWSVTESSRYTMPPAYDYKKLYVKLITAPGGATARTFTFRDNGADTALTTTITGAATTGNDTAHTITLGANGNTLGMKASNTGTPAASAGVKFGYVMAVPQDSVTYEDITYDAKSTQGFDASSTTLSHTTSGTNRLLVVAVAIDGSSTISSVTYAGVAMTLAKTFYNSTKRVSLYYLVAPATGANNIAVTLSGSDDAGIMAVSYNGVNQTAPFDDAIASDDSSSPYGQTITTRHTKELIVFASADDDWNAAARTPSGSSVERHDVILGSGAGDFGGFFSELVVATPSTNTLSYTNGAVIDSTGVIATFRPAPVSSTTGQIKIYNGSTWVPKPVKVWNGSAWVVKPLKRWDGSAWVTTPY